VVISDVSPEYCCRSTPVSPQYGKYDLLEKIFHFSFDAELRVLLILQREIEVKCSEELILLKKVIQLFRADEDRFNP
jgi:hypothetical protein